MRELFSLDPDLQHTYFSQPVDELRDLYPTSATPEALPEWKLRVQILLDTLAEERPAMLARRNRFLDHLMARYAERLQDHLDDPGRPLRRDARGRRAGQVRVLSRYPELGAARGLGFDYTREAPDNVSGLEQRLAHLLGFGTLRRDVYPERDADGKDEYRFRIRRAFTDGVLLSSTRHWDTPEEARAKLDEAIVAATQPGGYRRAQTAQGEFYFNVVDAQGHVVARRIQYFRTPAERDAAIEELIAIALAHTAERMCLVENILLRPRPDTKADEFLPICAEPDRAGCPGDDPYSYQLHVAFLAEAGRFRNMDFRRFAEDVVRRETPAHLAPKICWVSDKDMQRIENAWAAWRALLSGEQAAGRKEKFAELRAALYEAK